MVIQLQIDVMVMEMDNLDWVDSDDISFIFNDDIDCVCSGDSGI